MTFFKSEARVMGVRGAVLTAAALLAGLASTAIGQIGTPMVALRATAEPRMSMQTLALDANEYERMRAENEILMIGVPRGTGQSVDLELFRVEPFAPDATLVVVGPQGEVAMPLPDAQYFSGSVVGVPESRVFLSMGPSGTSGYIVTPDQTTIISSGPQGAGPIVAYDAAGPAASGLAISTPACSGGILLPGTEPEPVNTGTEFGERGGPCRVFRLAIETDREYLTETFVFNQTRATAYIGTLVAGMSDIYRRDVNAVFQVSYLRLWTTEDPWTGTSTSSQLSEYRTYWNTNMTSVSRDLGHFLSGRSLGGGVAYLSQACSTSAYAVSANLDGFFPYPLRDNDGANWDIMVFAHETGHNLGSRHTHDPAGYNPPIDGCGNAYLNPPGVQDCTAANLDIGTIMSYCHLCSGGMSNMRMELGSRVSTVVRNFINSRSTCGVSPSITITTQPQSRDVCTGEALELRTAATGTGTRTFQWRRNGVNIAGAIASTYSVAVASGADAGTYECVVTSGCVTQTTSPAVVTVGSCGCEYDFNNDQNVDLLDAQQMAAVAAGVIARQPGWLTGDVNRDENADLTDAQILAAYVASGVCGV